MAKLRIQAPNGKTLVVDVTGHDPAEYDDLAAAAVEDYMHPSGRLPEDVVNEEGLQSGVQTLTKPVGTMTKAGISGIADLAAGNGLEKAVESMGNVEEGKLPTTTAGNVGEKVGSLFTPEQIAAQAAIGAAIEASGIGPWLTDATKGWSEKAALAAIGYTKSIGKAIGLSNLDGLAQFLMAPVEIGGKKFPAILSATNDVNDMKAAAEAIKDAAGKQLGAVSDTVDTAISDAANSGGEALNNSKVAIDLPALRQQINVLKEKAVGGWEDLAPDVARKFDKALLSLEKFAKEQIQGTTSTTFSDLSELKTKLGNLANFGSQTESNLALQQIYGAISQTLDDAAKNLGGKVGADYALANAVYHKAITIVNALEGKALGSAAKGIFSDLPSMGLGVLAGVMNPAAAIPVAIGTHIARNYGMQGIAAGLNAAAPLMSTAMQAGLRTVPVVGTAIASALTDNQ